MGALKLQTGGIMTIRDTLRERLTEKGLDPTDAEQVLEALIEQILTEPGSSDIRKVMGEQVSAYPLPLLGVMCLRVETMASSWLEKNKPNHWAREMFS